MAQVVEGQHLEVPVSTPKIKGNRELHNLEYDINYDSRSLGSTRKMQEGSCYDVILPRLFFF
jgi:hypothetical protein